MAPRSGSSTDTVPTAAWRAYAAVGTALVGTYALLPLGLVRDVLYLVLGLGCVTGIVVGVLRHRPQGRSPWWWFAAGQLVWTAGDSTFNWLNDVLGVSPYPSVADAFYLAAYPLLAVGVVRLVRVRRPRAALESALDAAVVTVALGLLAWVLLAAPTAGSDAPLFEQAVGVAYPAGDILVLAGIAWLVTSMPRPLPSYRLLVAAVLVLVVGDVAFTLGSYGLFDDPRRLLDLTWLSSYVLWGTATLHPSMARLSSRSDAPAPSMSARRIVVLGASVLVPPALLAFEAVRDGDFDIWAFVASSTAMFVLVVLRLTLAIRAASRAIRVGEDLSDHLAHQAAHDSLTRLTSRARALELLDTALQRSAGQGTGVAVLFVDLDHFKRVNDLHGHAVGDHVLQVVAERMRAAVRPHDVVGRLGGDEFIVVVETVAGPDLGLSTAAHLLAAIGEDVVLPGSGQVLSVGASVGLALSRAGDGEPSGAGVVGAARLLHEADTAAYRAKAAGRGTVEVFDEVLRRHLAERQELEAALDHALAAGELVLHYQPVLAAVSGSLSGYEALVRWQRPGHGLVGPDAFVPFAEQSGAITRIGAWVLREACHQLVEWTRAQPTTYGALRVAVNVSGRHLQDAVLLDDVRTALESSGLEPDRLVVEVTETVLVDVHEVGERLAAVRALGVRLSIDDFGTGYTSFGQLATLPADELKIDRSLVTAATPGRTDLLRLMVHAAHAFGLVVVAEGIEDADQLDLVRGVGCDLVQGYLLGRPAPADPLPWAPPRVVAGLGVEEVEKERGDVVLRVGSLP
ncbi:putative bifunctional diguanylate cyclase/phosphodiesterase [Lapillicoccus jejuensis]|uniref:Diguanylate cyclase (GGDEF)-like protein n=1 Tax=Lapillicoccus jejuensis TaxID=402171 RepID=A0A542E1A3_9MICO|nr:EAL domain-containing protein [Lapillicoccus jejuensis]TQJ09049.1 diguanylate cyclase (GGDEF)-like protein [Lapillicoccus jejuensis]